MFFLNAHLIIYQVKKTFFCRPNNIHSCIQWDKKSLLYGKKQIIKLRQMLSSQSFCRKYEIFRLILNLRPNNISEKTVGALSD